MLSDCHITEANAVGKGGVGCSIHPGGTIYPTEIAVFPRYTEKREVTRLAVNAHGTSRKSGADLGQAVLAAFFLILAALCLSTPALADDRMALLERVNREVNAIQYRPDPPGQDLWGENWDCEEYALEKYRRLVEAGMDPKRLQVAGVIIGGGLGHAVLVVDPRTDAALVLDSRHDRVVHAWVYGPSLTRSIWPSLRDMLP